MVSRILLQENTHHSCFFTLHGVEIAALWSQTFLQKFRESNVFTKGFDEILFFFFCERLEFSFFTQCSVEKQEIHFDAKNVRQINLV